MMVRRKQPLIEADINLTPLIDVCFTILIMFILIAPLLEMERVELATAPAGEQSLALSAQEKSPIIIHVHEDDSLLFNQQPISLVHLTEALCRAKQKYPAATPQLFHDRNAKFGTYQSVKNAAERAGFSAIDVILKPQ